MPRRAVPDKPTPVSSRRRSGNPAVRSGRAEPAPRAPRPQTGPPSPAQLAADGVLPPDGAEYPQILRGESFARGRSILGAVFGLGLFIILVSVISKAVVLLVWAISAAGTDYLAYVNDADAFRRPVGLLAANLGIACLIPISWGLMWLVHQVRPRWLSSVQPRIRWRYLIGCAVIALVALNGALLASTLVAGPLHFGLQHGFWGFMVVIVLTSPIQAAAEEIFFRGYLMQTLGSLVARPWFGVLVSSVIFALLHGTLNPQLFLDRLAFGLLAAVLVWKTGGLEAGIAAHVVNNICAYAIAGFTTSIAALKAIQSVSWLDAAFDVGGFAVFAVLAYGLSRLLKLRTRVSLTPG